MAGNVKGITIEFNGDTTKLDKALREVRNSTKDTDRELKEVDKALKFNPTSVDLWRQKQNLLKDKIAQTQNNLSKLKDAQKQMDAKGVDKNSKEYRELQREIITTESKLKTFKAQLRALGNVKLQALGQQFKQIGAKMMGAGRTLSMYVTAPLVGAGTIAVKKFAEVDKTMTLTNSTMGNTAEEAKLLSDAMKEAAANSTYGMKDAATASLNFARAGLDATQAANTLAPAMALAAGEGGNLDTVSGGLVATINGFGDSFENAGTYADVFANACNNSALDVDSLSHAMSVAAPIFSAAGYEVNDAALYMGIMANNGIEADKAANSLKTGLARLIKPTDEAAGWMEKLGIEVTNADGSMKSSTEVQQSLHDAFSALTVAGIDKHGARESRRAKRSPRNRGNRDGHAGGHDERLRRILGKNQIRNRRRGDIAGRSAGTNATSSGERDPEAGRRLQRAITGHANDHRGIRSDRRGNRTAAPCNRRAGISGRNTNDELGSYIRSARRDHGPDWYCSRSHRGHRSSAGSCI